MLKAIPRGNTSNLIRAVIYKNDGTAYTGLTGSTSGLIIGTIADNETATTTYTQAATHIQTIATLGTYAAPSASECRFAEVDSTNHPGLYEFQFADARFAVAGSTELVISVSGAANIGVNNILQQIIDPVRGLGSPTAIPNAAAGGKGGLPILDATNGTQLQGFGSAQVQVSATTSLQIRTNTAQAGSSVTITLDAGASSTNDAYEGNLITVGNDTRTIISYVGSTKVATVDYAWTTNPTSSSAFTIDAADQVTATAIATASQTGAAAAIAAANLPPISAIGYPAQLVVSGTPTPSGIVGTYTITNQLFGTCAVYELAGTPYLLWCGAGQWAISTSLGSTTNSFSAATGFVTPWETVYAANGTFSGSITISLAPIPATDPNGIDPPGTAAIAAADLPTDASIQADAAAAVAANPSVTVAAWTDSAFQSLANFKKVYKHTYFVRVDGNDSNTGLQDSATGAFLTPAHAMSVAVAGDCIRIGYGTYALGSSQLLCMAGVDVIGAGKYATILTTALNSAIQSCFAPAANSLYQDFTIQGILSSNRQLIFGWGPGDAGGGTGITAVRLCLIGNSDGFYANTSGGSWVAYDCEINTTWDAVRITDPTGNYRFVNLLVTVNGPWIVDDEPENGLTHGVYVDSGNVVLQGGAITVTNNYDLADLGGNLECIAVKVRDTAVVTVLGVAMQTISQQGQPYDLEQLGGSLSEGGCKYTQSKVSGTIIPLRIDSAATDPNGSDAPGTKAIGNAGLAPLFTGTVNASPSPTTTTFASNTSYTGPASGYLLIDGVQVGFTYATSLFTLATALASPPNSGDAFVIPATGQNNPPSQEITVNFKPQTPQYRSGF